MISVFNLALVAEQEDLPFTELGICPDGNVLI